MLVKNLERGATLQILAYLFNKEKANRTDLRENLNAVMDTIYRALEKLKSLGLIEEVVSNSFPRTVEVYLTEKGVRVAKRVHEVENILQGNNNK